MVCAQVKQRSGLVQTVFSRTKRSVYTRVCVCVCGNYEGGFIRVVMFPAPPGGFSLVSRSAAARKGLPGQVRSGQVLSVGPGRWGPGL